jgi:MFS family permease
VPQSGDVNASVVRPRYGAPWVALVLISGSHAVIHAHSTLMPWIYPLALVDLRFSVTALGIMVGLGNLAGGLLQLGAGALTRTLRRRTLVGSGAVLLGVSALGTASATNFGQFFAANLAARIVTSTQHPLGNSLLADLYTRARQGTAIAAHVAGGNLGTVLLTPAAALLIGMWGWRKTVLVITIPAVLAGLAILFSIDERAGAARERSPWGDLRAAGLAVARSRNLLLIFAASLVGAGGRGLGVVILVVPLYLKRGLHLQEPYATELYTLLLVGSVAGPLAAGWVSDRVGRRPMLVAAYALSAVSTLALLMAPAHGLWLPLILAAVGLVVYSESPLLQAALADGAPPAERDAIFSLYFAVAFGIGALWAAGAGVLLDQFGYTPVFIVMAASYVVAGALSLGLREPRQHRPPPPLPMT